MVRRSLKDDDIRYSRVVGGRRYWEPSRKLKALGFKPKALGKESPQARRLAKDMTSKAEHALETKAQHVAGSLAHYFSKFRNVLAKRVERGVIKPRTLEEYDTAWTKIGPQLGETDIASITVEDVENFYFHLEDNFTPKVRHRAIGKLSIILGDAVTRRVIPTNPCDAVRNKAPAPRQAFFYPSEIDHLRQAAKDLGMVSMSICIHLIYKTARSPVDARLISLSQIGVNSSGPFVHRPREKTNVDSAQPIPVALYEEIMDYITDLGVTPHPDSPIFRRHKPHRRRQSNPVCEPWADESEFAKDFKIVREAAFGKEEKRRAMDIRRTANLEAKLGGASADDRAAMLANDINNNKKLDDVYTPPTLAAAIKAVKARDKGRLVLEQNKSVLTEKSVKLR